MPERTNGPIDARLCETAGGKVRSRPAWSRHSQQGFSADGIRYRPREGADSEASDMFRQTDGRTLMGRAAVVKRADLCGKDGVSEGAFGIGEAGHGGQAVSDAERLKTLEAGSPARKSGARTRYTMRRRRGRRWRNGVRPAVKRAAAAHRLASTGRSERRAQRGRGRSVCPTKTDLRQRASNPANERGRPGHRRLFLPLGRKGVPSSVNRCERLHRHEGLGPRRPGETQRCQHSRNDPARGATQCAPVIGCRA